MYKSNIWYTGNALNQQPAAHLCFLIHCLEIYRVSHNLGMPHFWKYFNWWKPNCAWKKEITHLRTPQHCLHSPRHDSFTAWVSRLAVNIFKRYYGVSLVWTASANLFRNPLKYPDCPELWIRVLDLVWEQVFNHFGPTPSTPRYPPLLVFSQSDILVFTATTFDWCCSRKQCDLIMFYLF